MLKKNVYLIFQWSRRVYFTTQASHSFCFLNFTRTHLNIETIICQKATEIEEFQPVDTFYDTCNNG